MGVNTTSPGSTLDINGSLAANYKTVTTNYTMTATDYHVSYTGTGNATFTLPAAISGAGNFKGRLYTINNRTSSTITVNPAGSETINGTASITIAANQSVQLINTGLTAGATWEVLGYNTTSTTGQTCVPDYIFVRPSSALLLSANTDVIFGNVLAQSGILYNSSTGVYTLTAGKTYELTAALYGTNADSNGFTEFYWVNASNNTPLPVTSYGAMATATYSGPTQSIPLATAFFTPSVDTMVKIRTTNSTTGTMTTGIGSPYAFIKQLNACGSSSGGSTSVTASNGLTAASNDVKLGGTLSAATTLTNNGNALNITGSGSTTTFSSNGYVGIGTATPGTKLEINNGTTNGAIKIVDGTQGVGKVLISDINGVGKWGNITGSWYSYLRGGYLDPAASSGTERKIDFSSGAVSTPGLGAINATTDEITVPYTGKYKVTLTGWWGIPPISGNFLAIAHIKINGIALWRPHVLGNSGPGTVGTCVSFSTLMDINANDVLTVYNQEQTNDYARQVGYSSAAATGANTYYPAQILVEYLGN